MSLRFLATAIAAVCLSFLFMTPARVSMAAGLALVYSGPGSAEDSPEALAAVIARMGLEPRYFEAPEELPKLLDAAVLLAVGGTDDDTRELRESFSEKIVLAIRRFVANGGRYCGICGGAYLPSDHWQEDGLVHGFGLAPVSPDNFKNYPPPMLLPIRWGGETRNMYYQLGPYFDILESDASLQVLAWYDDESAAALTCAFGRGKVLLSGPHPEAPRAWIEDADLEVGDWQSSADLLEAALRDLLSDRPLN